MNESMNYLFTLGVTVRALALSFLFNMVLTVTARLYLLLSK